MPDFSCSSRQLHGFSQQSNEVKCRSRPSSNAAHVQGHSTCLCATKMTGRSPTPAAIRRSISCPTVARMGSDDPCVNGDGDHEHVDRVPTSTEDGPGAVCKPTTRQRKLYFSVLEATCRAGCHGRGHTRECSQNPKTEGTCSPPSQRRGRRTPCSAASPAAGPRPATPTASTPEGTQAHHAGLRTPAA